MDLPITVNMVIFQASMFFSRQEPHQMRASSSEADVSLGVRAMAESSGTEEGMVQCTTCYSLILVTRIYIYSI